MCRGRRTRPAPRPPRFSSRADRGGEKIVGLVAGAARIGEAAGRDEIGDDRELLDDVVVEFAAALIGRKGFVPVGFRFQSVPGDDDGARLLDRHKAAASRLAKPRMAPAGWSPLRRIVFGNA